MLKTKNSTFLQVVALNINETIHSNATVVGQDRIKRISGTGGVVDSSDRAGTIQDPDVDAIFSCGSFGLINLQKFHLGFNRNRGPVEAQSSASVFDSVTFKFD